jgi:hypothetical protein
MHGELLWLIFSPTHIYRHYILDLVIINVLLVAELCSALMFAKLDDLECFLTGWYVYSHLFCFHFELGWLSGSRRGMQTIVCKPYCVKVYVVSFISETLIFNYRRLWKKYYIVYDGLYTIDVYSLCIRYLCNWLTWLIHCYMPITKFTT